MTIKLADYIKNLQEAFTLEEWIEIYKRGGYELIDKEEGIIYGTVTWFNDDKGYGFILGEDDKEYFIFYKNIIKKEFKTLYEGERVKFKQKDSFICKYEAYDVNSL